MVGKAGHRRHCKSRGHGIPSWGSWARARTAARPPRQQQPHLKAKSSSSRKLNSSDCMSCPSASYVLQGAAQGRGGVWTADSAASGAPGAARSECATWHAPQGACPKWAGARREGCTGGVHAPGEAGVHRNALEGGHVVEHAEGDVLKGLPQRLAPCRHQQYSGWHVSACASVHRGRAAASGSAAAALPAACACQAAGPSHACSCTSAVWSRSAQAGEERGSRVN